jgi:putative transposase
LSVSEFLAHARRLVVVSGGGLQWALKGAGSRAGATAAQAHDYVPHMRRIGEEKLDPASGEQRFPTRRWVVERTLAWLSKCRALLVRYDKHAANFRGLLQFACALLWFRRLHRLFVLR